MSGFIRIGAVLVAFWLCRSGAQASDAASMTLDHISLHVADVERSLRFYTETLGLSEIKAQYPGRHWLSIGNGTAIHLAGDRKSALADDDDVHFAIAVRDLDPVMARLRAHGVVWVGSDDKPYGISTTRADGVRQIYFKDPDGYWIEINDALARAVSRGSRSYPLANRSIGGNSPPSKTSPFPPYHPWIDGSCL